MNVEETKPEYPTASVKDAPAAGVVVAQPAKPAAEPPAGKPIWPSGMLANEAREWEKDAESLDELARPVESEGEG